MGTYNGNPIMVNSMAKQLSTHNSPTIYWYSVGNYISDHQMIMALVDPPPTSKSLSKNAHIYPTKVLVFYTSMMFIYYDWNFVRQEKVSSTTTLISDTPGDKPGIDQRDYVDDCNKWLSTSPKNLVGCSRSTYWGAKVVKLWGWD